MKLHCTDLEDDKMTAEILIKFARKGIILSPEAYNLICDSDNPLNLSSEIIVKLKSGNYSNDMVPVDVKTLENMEGLNLKIKSGDKRQTPMVQTKEEPVPKVKTTPEVPKPEIQKPQTTPEVPKVETTASLIPLKNQICKSECKG